MTADGAGINMVRPRKLTAHVINQLKGCKLKPCSPFTQKTQKKPIFTRFYEHFAVSGRKFNEKRKKYKFFLKKIAWLPVIIGIESILGGSVAVYSSLIEKDY